MKIVGIIYGMAVTAHSFLVTLPSNRSKNKQGEENTLGLADISPSDT
jgi:hypothetical protein